MITQICSVESTRLHLHSGILQVLLPPGLIYQDNRDKLGLIFIHCWDHDFAYWSSKTFPNLFIYFFAFYAGWAILFTI